MPETFSIGEVINLLRDEFPDVSVSKIRFLESQGLIDPNRSDGGYRQFDSHDLARLRFILRQQRDHFLPLKVIKSKLTLWERGEDLESRLGDSDSMLEEEGQPLSREDVLKRSGLSESQLDALMDAGIVQLVPDSTVFGAEVGVVALEAKRLIDQGLEPRHLRSIRLSVDREADLLLQLATPLLRSSNPEAKARARDVIESTSGSVQAMHRLLLLAELKRHISE